MQNDVMEIVTIYVLRSYGSGTDEESSMDFVIKPLTDILY
jgi:hypothetical protein